MHRISTVKRKTKERKKHEEEPDPETTNILMEGGLEYIKSKCTCVCNTGTSVSRQQKKMA